MAEILSAISSRFSQSPVIQPFPKRLLNLIATKVTIRAQSPACFPVQNSYSLFPSLRYPAAIPSALERPTHPCQLQRTEPEYVLPRLRLSEVPAQPLLSNT